MPQVTSTSGNGLSYSESHSIIKVSDPRFRSLVLAFRQNRNRASIDWRHGVGVHAAPVRVFPVTVAGWGVNIRSLLSSPCTTGINEVVGCSAAVPTLEPVADSETRSHRYSGAATSLLRVSACESQFRRGNIVGLRRGRKAGKILPRVVPIS